MNSEVLEKTTKPKLKKPSKFQVILLNDDYTTMEFVIEVLQKVFHKSIEQAQQLMMNIHIDGQGICGTYSFDIAQTKVKQVLDYAQHKQQPLMCVLKELN